MGEAYLLIMHNSTTTPPKVVRTKLPTKGSHVTGFVITFSKPMAPGPVPDVNDRIIAATRTIALKSADYNPSTHAVTLNIAGKAPIYPMISILSRGTNYAVNEVGTLASQGTSPTATSNPPRRRCIARPLGWW